MTKYREEHANVLVAQALNWLLGGNLVKSETKGRHDRKLLDLEFESYGARIIIEAKYNDCQAAAAAADSRLRLDPPPDAVGALSYSPEFEKNAAFAISKDAPIEFAFKSRDDIGGEWRWRRGTVYDLAQSLRRPQTITAPRDDEIKRAIDHIRGALALFAGAFGEKPAAAEKVAEVLQIKLAPENKDDQISDAVRAGGLILIGALMFQFALGEKDRRVHLPTMLSAASDFRNHWEYILREINYVAVFDVALRVLKAGNVGYREIKGLVDVAQNVFPTARDGVDLIGRIYHTLLSDAKTLAAFYTSIPAATLMAGISLAPEMWGDSERWASRDFIRKFRLADPACGSGTLLAAACWQIRDNFARADFRKRGGQFGGSKERQDLCEVHRILMEDCVWGYDILETATHLTATTLGLISPEVDFKKAHIYRAFIGKAEYGVATGSLVLIESDRPYMGARSAHIETRKHTDPMPKLDLCIMNPPFVSGRVNQESFDFLPDDERDLVRKKIQRLGKDHGFSLTHGQGPGFVVLGCKSVNPGGRLAMILPVTFATGMGRSSWRVVRKLVERDFDLEMLIVSRDPDRPNFSDSTNFQECIVVARKRRGGEAPQDEALFVVLSRNPNNGEEARVLASEILSARKKGGIGSFNNADSIMRGDSGSFAVLPYRGRSAWCGLPFSDALLNVAAMKFCDEGVLSPFVEKRLALRPLGELAVLGSYRLNKYLAGKGEKKRAEIRKFGVSPYAGYYPAHRKREQGVGHKDIPDITGMPHFSVLPLPGQESWAKKYFADAGRIVLSMSVRLHTTRRFAALLPHPVQAAHCHPIRLRDESEEKLKAIALWLNSTPAILAIAGVANQTDGSKISLTESAAETLPALDLDALSDSQIAGLASAFDEIVALTARGEGLLPLPQMETDSTRAKLDTAISNALGVGDFRHLRVALAREPIITGRQQSVD